MGSAVVNQGGAAAQGESVIAGPGLECPRCGGCHIKRDGKTSARKQRWKCKYCGRVFVVDITGRISPLVKELADNLIKQGVEVPVLVKAFQGHASRRWLYQRRSEIRECS